MNGQIERKRKRRVGARREKGERGRERLYEIPLYEKTASNFSFPQLRKENGRGGEKLLIRQDSKQEVDEQEKQASSVMITTPQNPKAHFRFPSRPERGQKISKKSIYSKPPLDL